MLAFAGLFYESSVDRPPMQVAKTGLLVFSEKFQTLVDLHCPKPPRPKGAQGIIGYVGPRRAKPLPTTA